MCGQPGTLADIKFRYVNAQRWEINLRSRIDEQLIYRPHLGSISHAHRPVDTSRMGALTTSFTQALILYNAGLPVWYVYEASVASPSRFKRFLSDQEVDQMSGCIEIPPDGLQMGEYSGNVPSLTWLTGGQPFITRTVAPKAVSLFHGPAGHPNRYEAMTNVLSGFRCPWEAPQQPAANFSTSPAREVEHEFTFEFPLPSAGDDDFPGPPVSDSASLDASSSTSVAPSTSAPVASSTASVASGSAPPPTSPLKPGMSDWMSCLRHLSFSNVQP
ncbi:hypothetical protein CYLTODRAFT_267337 [Cylindrobasidium torrendii FP15055 ss-10]|uniref:Uncharacterized protein n=1 Tax=Cylindrobasidium torrendii FP15055 ss-10 TaxID=1314674 RepID=A0A0D7AR64_9AGAR|nr:hypothetical protein CYLTODRAFT_267337 [Cylindrobasidium torrendii FP15055 ss-10]